MPHALWHPCVLEPRRSGLPLAGPSSVACRLSINGHLMVWLILAARHPSPYSATPVVTDTFFPHASIPHLVLRKLMMLESPML